MTFILIKRTDGGVSIATTSSIQKTIDTWKTLHPGEYVSHRVISAEHLPASRVFRDAWTDDGTGDRIDINMSRARDHIRTVRNNSLSRLDKEVFTEQRKPNGKVSQLEAKARKLRDIPEDPRFDSENIEDLEALLKEADL